METLVLVILTFTVTFASSVFSAAIVPVAFLFDVSQEATDLGVSVFVLGFSVGSSIWFVYIISLTGIRVRVNVFTGALLQSFMAERHHW